MPDSSLHRACLTKDKAPNTVYTYSIGMRSRTPFHDEIHLLEEELRQRAAILQRNIEHDTTINVLVLADELRFVREAIKILGEHKQGGRKLG